MSASVNNLINGSSSELSDLKTYSNISQEYITCDIEAHCHLQNAKRYYHACIAFNKYNIVTIKIIQLSSLLLPEV